MWAVVPLKSPALAKSRLAAVLSAEQRRAWFFQMARRAIAALQAARGIERVAVITPDAEVAHFARELGAEVLHEGEENGTAQAFALALDQLRPRSPPAVLMIAGDLPLVSAPSLEILIEASARHDVVIVPDRLQCGTNALLCRPPGAIAPCFGHSSFARHLTAARRSGLSYRTLQLPELALDIDVPADIEELCRHAAAGVPGLPLPQELASPGRVAA